MGKTRYGDGDGGVKLNRRGFRRLHAHEGLEAFLQCFAFCLAHFDQHLRQFFRAEIGDDAAVVYDMQAVAAIPAEIAGTNERVRDVFNGKRRHGKFARQGLHFAQHRTERAGFRFRRFALLALVRQNVIDAFIHAREFREDIHQRALHLHRDAGQFVFVAIAFICLVYSFLNNDPFRWVCTSGKKEDLDKTDAIATAILRGMLKDALTDGDAVLNQLKDNLLWIENADTNIPIVGSKARILYADAVGRVKIAQAFNDALAKNIISAPIVLGRDHHDVSGTDSPFRETSNIYDGSRFTADMAVQNFVGDAFRGATWVSLHNGGGVGWGEVINGGFGMVLDGSADSERRLKSMLFWDVNNGIARRSWARNEGAMTTIKKAMTDNPDLVVTLPNLVDDSILDNLTL